MGAEEIVSDVTERVRKLVGEAEEKAAKIVSDAEADAKRIRERAEAKAAERLDEVRAAIDDLQGKLGSGQRSEVVPEPKPVPEPQPPATPEPTPDPVPDPVPGPEPVPEPTPQPAPEPVPPTPGETSGNGPSTVGDAGPDTAGARLVAMKMALDGASREEIEQALDEQYSGQDLGEVVDDVLARAGA